ncbi:hypothetical protein GQ457_01G002270 [Hibiscus cannabinus]
MEQAAVTTERKVEVSGEPVKEAESSKVGLTKDCQEGGGRQERPEGQYGHKRVWGAGPTLFIENIPRRMHWKGLWHLFARHGDVYRAYIANKLSRGGKRFGFVSFGTERDALRALERLNGFSVYGFTLTVKLANHNNWRVSGKQHGDQINKRLDGQQQPMNIQISRGMSQREEHKRKVVGHVIDEDLWKLQRCLIGEMAMVCSVHSVVKRLEQWGLNGIKVHRMGGKDQSKDVGRPSKKGSQECSIENDEEGVKDVGLSANVGIGVLKDKKVVDKHHVWANHYFEAQGEVDTLYSFRELDSEFAGKKNRTAKKFGSLWELQGRALSKTERKKRDRTLGCKKINKEDLQDSELSGRSLSDTDLRGKWEQAKKEARRTLELGKKFGLKIKGSEEEAWSAEEIRKIWSDDDFEFRMGEADGRSGGLVTIWDRNCFTLESVCQNKNFLAITGRWIRLDVQVKIVNVYAPCSVAEQAKLWEEFYALKVNDSTHCSTVKGKEVRDKIVWLHDSLRKVWLVSVAAALWVIWSARNDKIFNKKQTLPKEWLFQSKPRALVWMKTIKGLKFGDLEGWWEDPRSAVMHHSVKSRPTSDSFKFTVLTAAEGRTIGCGGSLVSEKGDLRAIFSGQALHPELVPAVFEAVKRALQTFIEADCFGGGKLTVEVGSRKVLNWIVNPLQCPWHWWKDLAEIDALIHRIKLVSFSSLNLNGSETALWLAKDGVWRLDFFRAWW